MIRLLRWMYRTDMPGKVRGAHRLSGMIARRHTSFPVLIDGYPPLYIDLSSGHWQARELFCKTPLKTWIYEPHVLRVMREIVRAGDIAFDIGANIGFYSIVLNSLKAEVYSFEPNMRLLPNLEKSLKGLTPKITVLPLALSDESGSATLYVPEGGGHDMASFGQWRKSADEFQCRMATLDSLGLPQPDFIKCDVEGAEAKVFRGAAKMVSDAHRAPVIIFEEHLGMANALGLDKQAAQKYLASVPSRYSFLLIDKESGKLQPSAGERPYWCDVLAVPECKMERLRRAR